MVSSKDESYRQARKASASRTVARTLNIPPTEIACDHGGEGSIFFRRLFSVEGCEASIDFIDHTTVPPGSSIGIHAHHGNDEVYLVVSGTATMVVDGEMHVVSPGDVILTTSRSSHGLTNDGKEPLVMFVVQVGHR